MSYTFRYFYPFYSSLIKLLATKKLKFFLSIPANFFPKMKHPRLGFLVNLDITKNFCVNACIVSINEKNLSNCKLALEKHSR